VVAFVFDEPGLLGGRVQSLGKSLTSRLWPSARNAQVNHSIELFPLALKLAASGKRSAPAPSRQS
jgi:hypothetical protein